MNKIKNTAKASVGLGLLAVNNLVMAASNKSSSTFNQGNTADKLETTNSTLDNMIINWISYITGFLYLVALIIGLWGAFNILTAAGDEDKVKTGKSIIIRAVLGIVAIFAVNVIMRFVINALFSNS
ncbi:hypothetical protein BKN14_03475 [Candidatus Gracilibacteria bacterium HOT-871]|nr:hypothetical protein BKN14_03475 [Candidatus Gracilibacteria bacterium HOT-871]MBB1564720.1 hypothetical protein [Candidatus Gracilibacteria bacterium]MBF0914021.1 hypothetical protein [Candidatus Gracilibacteria bacterium]RKW20594.1 MAG: hypothetical protein D8B46_09280 [Candidatus Gracilibacteria bacterium]